MSLRAINISGQALRSQSVKFASISENIANLNTTGYKKGRVTFSEQIAGESGAVSPAGFNGGNETGPTSTAQNFSAMKANVRRNHVDDATIVKTDNKLDVAIRGAGQLIVREYTGERNEIAGQTYLTSAGSLKLLPWYTDGIRKVGSEGLYLADQNGHQVMGLSYNEDTFEFDKGTNVDSLSPIRVNRAVAKEAVNPILSSIFRMTGNLRSDSADGEKVVINTNFFNGAGIVNAEGDGKDPTVNDVIPMNISMEKMDNNVWSIAFLNVNLVDGQDVATLEPDQYPDARNTPILVLETEAIQRASGWKIQFDGEGKPLRMWQGTSKFPNPADTIFDLNAEMPTINFQYTAPTDESLEFDPDDPTRRIDLLPGQDKYELLDVDVSIDMTEWSTYGGTNTTLLKQNGRTVDVRQFVNFGIESDGIVYRYFDDKSKVPLSKLAYGTVPSLTNLKPTSGTLLEISGESGVLKVNTFDEDKSSGLVVGSLEVSDVDLAEEFSDMIINQRAYSLSTKTLTTAIEMNERAVQLKK